MLPSRKLIGRALLGSVLGALAAGSGCGTDATGIGDCRAIERARCRAAVACEIIDDADDCRRFYRDQCLHGLPVDSPGGPGIEACVAAIDAAGACARAGFTDCDPNACEVVLRPQTTSECAFLDPDAEPSEEPGSGGSAGTSGSAGSGATDAGAGGASDSAGGASG